MEKSNYKYDINNDSDIHCKECKFIVNPNSYKQYCEKLGTTVHDCGYCNLAEKRSD